MPPLWAAITATAELLAGIASIVLAVGGLGLGALGAFGGTVMMVEPCLRRLGALYAAAGLTLFFVSLWALAVHGA